VQSAGGIGWFLCCIAGCREGPRNGPHSRPSIAADDANFPDLEVVLRDPRTLEPVKTLTNHLPVRWFTVTPDGQRLLVGQSDSTDRDLMTLWDLGSGERLWSRSGPSGGNGSLSADGSRYLSQRGWYLWTLWDIENGDPICAVVTSEINQRPMLAPNGALHMGSLHAPAIWPSAAETAGERD
jgi:WD40 repeat protein